MNKETDNRTIITRIAEAFLGAFSSIYIVNSDTNEYQWYSINPEFNSLQIFLDLTNQLLIERIVQPDLLIRRMVYPF